MSILPERMTSLHGLPGRDFFHPLSGWVLIDLMRMDAAAPGILRHATEAAPAWRNAVATALAVGVLGRCEDFLLRANGCVEDRDLEAQVSEALVSMRPSRILEAALGEVPLSLMGTLKKIGCTPLNTPAAYVRLVEMLRSTNPDARARRKVLEHINERLDDELLQTLSIIDPTCLSPAAVLAIRTASEAHKVNARLAVVREICSTATDDALRQSIENARHLRPGLWLRSWLGRADRLPPLGIPLDDDPSARRIFPADAHNAGKRWQNCLAGHVNSMISGATAYFEIDDQNVLVVLTRVDEGWLLTGIHARANFPVHRGVPKRVKDRLSPLGVKCFLPAGPPPPLEAVAGAFHGVDDLDFTLEGMGP
jgi:hypothetical protein